jgi:hypothetical protein
VGNQEKRRKELGYDAIFIASYVCWILFELVTGSSRKAKGAAKAQDRRIILLFDRDDLAGNVLARTRRLVPFLI